MSEDEDRQADLNRQFEAVIGGAELDDLRELPGEGLTLGEALAPETRSRSTRPELRRPPLAQLQLFSVRVDLNRSEPPIWRRLELRSDLSLDVVHKVLQVAFAWLDYHLWRFSLGGDAFDPASQAFVCPQDDLEDDLDDESQILGSDVRIDEVLQSPGDVISYLYDYGDNWELTLMLEGVSPAASDTPSAIIVDGRRAAPPEDCGGARSARELAEVMEDPAHFEISDVSPGLRSAFMLLTEHGFDRRFADLTHWLAHSAIGEDLTGRARGLLTDPGPPTEPELRDSFRAFRWFLDRAAEGPIPLTAAGYLKPADVQAAAAVLPTMGGWIGKSNREIDTTPVLVFRELMQRLGLLRRYKGTLRLTRAGARAHSAPERLWNLLADKLVRADDGFLMQATLLLLAYAATSADAEIPLDEIAVALNHLGWRVNGVDPITASSLYRLPALEVLASVADAPRDRFGRWPVSPAGARLARAALKPR